MMLFTSFGISSFTPAEYANVVQLFASELPDLKIDALYGFTRLEIIEEIAERVTAGSRLVVVDLRGASSMDPHAARIMLHELPGAHDFTPPPGAVVRSSLDPVAIRAHELGADVFMWTFSRNKASRSARQAGEAMRIYLQGPRFISQLHARPTQVLVAVTGVVFDAAMTVDRRVKICIRTSGRQTVVVPITGLVTGFAHESSGNDVYFCYNPELLKLRNLLPLGQRFAFAIANHSIKATVYIELAEKATFSLAYTGSSVTAGDVLGTLVGQAYVDVVLTQVPPNSVLPLQWSNVEARQLLYTIEYQE